MFDHKRKHTFIFHRTVLEGHCELDVETGTRMTAASCSFRWFGLFSQPNASFFTNVEKPWKFGAKNRHFRVVWIGFHGEMTVDGIEISKIG